jgi:leucine-rich repeat protein SHOC2
MEVDRMEESTPNANASAVNTQFSREKSKTAVLVRRLSEDGAPSPMAPEYVVLEAKNEQTGKLIRRSVYVTEQNGTKTLDLYSGWNPESQKHKVPLKALPAKVCQLTSLERLWVSHNRLSSLPSQLDQITTLREVFLHRNNLEEMPLCLCNLPNLHLLWLNNNKITRIPDEIAKLKSLKRLHLDSNFIKDFPTSLCELTQLEVLYLNHNAIDQINEDVGNLVNLKRLYLDHNKITDIPYGVTKLVNILLLLLDDNEIRSVRREFSVYQANMESAGKVVSLKNNPFVTPQSKLKLSLAGIGGPPNLAGIRSRRLSDQYERESVRRPARVSLPINSESESEQHGKYKADTLPRSNTALAGYPMSK